jgi:hypothetical protein
MKRAAPLASALGAAFLSALRGRGDGFVGVMQCIFEVVSTPLDWCLLAAGSCHSGYLTHIAFE